MTVYKLFNIINSRLAEIENPIIRTEGYDPPHYLELMSSIENNIDLFSVSDACDHLKNYLGRIEVQIKRLIDEVPKEAREIKRPVPITKEVLNIPPEIFIIEELEYYHERLQFMLDVRSKYFQIPVVQELVIQLPEGFRVRELEQHFNQYFTQDQAALLLYYFRENKLIPNYSNTHLGLLAQYFFGRDKSDVRKAVGRVHSFKENREDLLYIKKALLSLVESINADIEKAH